MTRSRAGRWGWIGAGLVGLAGVVWIAVDLAGPRGPSGARAGLSPAEALAGDDTAGYARADRPRSFVFPRDHGPHPEFRTEWWYVTANLEAEDGRRFGIQLTLFRNAVAPEVPARRSAWSTNQVWMAHFAVTDAAADRHVHGERLARGAAGLAGGRADPFRVWLADWELRGPEEGGGIFPLSLRAGEGDGAFELTVEAGKPPVFQGEDGLSRKGPEPGNASYYYSFTRLPARGVVEVGGERVRVEGAAWMDREWSTSALGPEHVGWDWFALQLSDGREIMHFELRREDGRPDPLNHGALVEPDGAWHLLASADVAIEVLDRWESPRDGTSYPSGWRLRIPGRGVDLRVEPLVQDQEMDLSFRYWEGAVRVEGRGVDGPVEGHGYVELTGYGDGPP